MLGSGVLQLGKQRLGMISSLQLALACSPGAEVLNVQVPELYAKGPCTQTVDTLAPKYLYRDYFKANVSTTWVHEPLDPKPALRPLIRALMVPLKNPFKEPYLGT